MSTFFILKIIFFWLYLLIFMWAEKGYFLMIFLNFIYKYYKYEKHSVSHHVIKGDLL